MAAENANRRAGDPAAAIFLAEQIVTENSSLPKNRQVSKPDEPHCRGCGVRRGQRKITWRDEVTSPRDGKRVPVDHGPARLVPVDFGAGGVWLLCQVCVRRAQRITANVAKYSQAAPDRPKPVEPDPRQLDLLGGAP